MSDHYASRPIPRHISIYSRQLVFLPRPDEYPQTIAAPSTELEGFVNRVVEVMTPITGVLTPYFRNASFAFLIHPEDDGFACAAVSVESLPDRERRRKATFNVFSRMITNKRYNESDGRHFSKAHSHEDAAVASARRYIRRPTKDIFFTLASNAGCSSLRHLTTAVMEDIDKEVYDTLSAVPGLDKAILRRNTLSEFYKLVESSILGAALQHYASLPEAPASLRTALDGVVAAKERRVSFCSTHSTSMAFIFLSGANMETAHVAQGHVLGLNSWDCSFSRHTEYTCPFEELSELVRGRISVLNMCNPKVDIPYTTVQRERIVEGVGMRLSERCFFMVLE